MKLEDMSMKDLLVLHNKIALKPAGPKTFATRGKLVARIEAIAADQNIDVASFRRPQTPEAAVPSTQPHADAIETTKVRTETEKRPGGQRVGELARQLLMGGAGWPHAVIASMVNAEITGAAATAKSIRWYACKLRKQGAQVPERQRASSAKMDVELTAK